MSGACVVDDLPGKKQVFIVHGKRLPWLQILGPFEEKDKAINLGLDLGDKLIVVHAVDFLNLGGGDPQLVNELCENCRI